jgi:hypothetical protein
MKINFKQPKYLVPLMALAVICLVFFLYHKARQGGAMSSKIARSGIKASVGDVSPEEKKKALPDKMGAYASRYKQADGQSALMPLAVDTSPGVAATPAGTGTGMPEKKFYPAPPVRIQQPGADEDRDLQQAIEKLAASRDGAPQGQSAAQQQPAAERDPMQIFRQQMAYMDSMRQASDPALAAQAREQKLKAGQLRAGRKELVVEKAAEPAGQFNTLRPVGDGQEPIMAAVDQELTGFAGSRVRLRLLSDIRAGGTLIKSGTCLYAIITGFSAQRVSLAVRSIFYQGNFLPLNLQVYDLDGLEGLYVPDSHFRDFTRELGASSIQGVSIDGGASQGSQFVMSTAGKVFQSASSAIATAIRKNKVRIGFNSYIYLVDQHAPKAQ